MGLEPCRLVSDEPVAVGVGLVEGVVGERFDDVEQLGAQSLLVPGGDAAGHELLALGLDERPVLLPARLAQVVRLGQVVAGDLLGHPHDRLLVDHQPVGVAEDRFEVGVEVRDGLAAVLAVGVVAVHVGGHGARPVQGHQGGHVVEAGRGERPHQRPHRPTLELEHPHRVPPAQHGEGVRVVEGHAVDVRAVPGGHLDEVEGPLDDRQVAQPEEVHLEQPQVLDPVHLVLGHDGGVVGVVPVRLALDGNVLGHRFVGDDHGGGMDAVLAPQTLEAVGHVDDLFGLGIGLVHGPELGGGGESVFVAFGAGQAGGQRGVAAHEQGRHGLGDLVAHDVGVAEHPGGIAHRGPRLDGGERDDLGHVVGSVPFGGVLDHVAAVPFVEVHVDVGHLHPARVEEPFEEQVVADGIDIDDLEAVGHAAPGG